MTKSGRQRRFRPGIEALDARELPSSFGGHLARTPAWVNENLIQSLAGTLYAPITTTAPIQVGGTIFPAGHVFGPAADARRNRAANFLGRVRRTLFGRAAQVLEPGRHDPHLTATANRWPPASSTRAAPRSCSSRRQTRPPSRRPKTPSPDRSTDW